MVSHEFSNINLPVLLWVEGGGKRKEKKGRVGKDGGEVTEGRKGRGKGREKGRGEKKGRKKKRWEKGREKEGEKKRVGKKKGGKKGKEGRGKGGGEGGGEGITTMWLGPRRTAWDPKSSRSISNEVRTILKEAKWTLYNCR